MIKVIGENNKAEWENKQLLEDVILCSLDREGDPNRGVKDVMERAGGISRGRKLGVSR